MAARNATLVPTDTQRAGYHRPDSVASDQPCVRLSHLTAVWPQRLSVNVIPDFAFESSLSPCPGVPGIGQSPREGSRGPIDVSLERPTYFDALSPS